MQITKRRIREIVLEEMAHFAEGAEVTPEIVQGAFGALDEAVREADNLETLADLADKVGRLSKLIKEQLDNVEGE